MSDHRLGVACVWQLDPEGARKPIIGWHDPHEKWKVSLLGTYLAVEAT